MGLMPQGGPDGRIDNLRLPAIRIYIGTADDDVLSFAPPGHRTIEVQLRASENRARRPGLQFRLVDLRRLRNHRGLRRLPFLLRGHARPFYPLRPVRGYRASAPGRTSC